MTTNDPAGPAGSFHVKRTRPYRPQTNGKAERFIKTLLRRVAQAKLYRSNAQRFAALPRWVHFYNHVRPHPSDEVGGGDPKGQPAVDQGASRRDVDVEQVVVDDRPG